MTWFKVDDGLADAPDVVKLSESKHYASAMGLWCLAGSWCAKHLTDGFVPSRMIARLGCKKAHADALVNAGMWEPSEGGYQFRNWLKYQPSRSDVRAKQGAARERMKRARSREHNENRSREQTANVRQPRPDPTINHTNTTPPTPPPGGGAAAWVSDSLGSTMRTRFQAAWLSARGVDPNMGGRSVGDLPGRVERTAEAQGVDPLDLFDRCLGAFLSGPLDDVAKRAPYAVFTARFSELADRGPSAPRDSADRLEREMRKAREDAEREMRADMARRLGVSNG